MPKANVDLSDRQWSEITKRLKLPDEARARIDQEIAWFSDLNKNWRQSPSAVKKTLNSVSLTALKLAKLLDDLEDQERVELLEAWPLELSTLEITLGRIDAMILRVRTLSSACQNADISKLTGPDRVDGLIERLDMILRKHLGVGVSESKSVMTLLTEVFRAARIDLKDRSIRLAVHGFRDRGKN